MTDEEIRAEACMCAATVLAGRGELKFLPNAWSLCVFFESYIREGADGTQKDFGPKGKKMKATVLKLVKG